MKDRALLVILVVALVAIAGGPPVAQALSTPLGELKNTAVSCGSTGDPEIINPGGTSMCIQNSSATCVRIGGSGVTTATGLSIGDGCPGGKVYCADAKVAYCEAESSTVDVQVVYGSN
jgi:hypothetical protein